VSGIYYALSIIAIVVVIHWFITNDGRKQGEPTKGLLAIREATAPVVPAPSGSSRQRGKAPQANGENGGPAGPAA
jgi:hypothetical protein